MPLLRDLPLRHWGGTHFWQQNFTVTPKVGYAFFTSTFLEKDHPPPYEKFWTVPNANCCNLGHSVISFRPLGRGPWPPYSPPPWSWLSVHEIHLSCPQLYCQWNKFDIRHKYSFSGGGGVLPNFFLKFLPPPPPKFLDLLLKTHQALSTLKIISYIP